MPAPALRVCRAPRFGREGRGLIPANQEPLRRCESRLNAPCPERRRRHQSCANRPCSLHPPSSACRLTALAFSGEGRPDQDVQSYHGSRGATAQPWRRDINRRATVPVRPSAAATPGWAAGRGIPARRPPHGTRPPPTTDCRRVRDVRSAGRPDACTWFRVSAETPRVRWVAADRPPSSALERFFRGPPASCRTHAAWTPCSAGRHSARPARRRQEPLRGLAAQRYEPFSGGRTRERSDRGVRPPATAGWRRTHRSVTPSKMPYPGSDHCLRVRATRTFSTTPTSCTRSELGTVEGFTVKEKRGYVEEPPASQRCTRAIATETNDRNGKANQSVHAPPRSGGGVRVAVQPDSTVSSRLTAASA